MAKCFTNGNSSINSDKENNLKNSQLILNSQDIAKIEIEDLAESELVKTLESLEIIEDFSFDRVDEETKETHAHFYFNKNGNVDYNSLSYLFNNFIQTQKVDFFKIEEIKGKIMENAKIEINGIVENSASNFRINEDLKKELVENVENIYYVSSDLKTKLKKIKSFAENTGLKGTDKPINILNNEETQGLKGRYDFEIMFDKSAENVDVEELKNNMLKTFNNNYENMKLDHLDLEIEVEDNSIKISFNNLLKDNIENKYYMISKTNVKRDLEEGLLRYSRNQENVKFTTNSKSFHFHSQEKYNEILAKEQEKEISKIEIENEKIEKVKARIEEMKPEKVEEKSIDNSKIEKYEKEIIENSKSLEDQKIDIEAKIEKLNEVKDIIDITKKIEELEAKKVILENFIERKNEVERLKTNNDKLTKNNEILKSNNEILTNANTKLTNDNLDLTKDNSILKTDNETLTKDNSILKTDIETLTNTNTELKNEIETLTNTNTALKTDIEALNDNFEKAYNFVDEYEKVIRAINPDFDFDNVEKYINEKIEKDKLEKENRERIRQ